jgi:hypothetical protein
MLLDSQELWMNPVDPRFRLLYLTRSVDSVKYQTAADQHCPCEYCSLQVLQYLCRYWGCKNAFPPGDVASLKRKWHCCWCSDLWSAIAESNEAVTSL